METGSHELAILSYATVCLHPSVSLNNDKICREFSEHKIAVCEKTAGLRSGNSSDLNSACLKVLVPVEIFQFSDMHYETERNRDSTDGLPRHLKNLGAVHMSRASPANRADLSHENLYFSNVLFSLMASFHVA